MPFTHAFKPTHKEIKRYYEELADYATQKVTHEGATSSAFQNLLATTCKKADWFLVSQLATKIKGKTVRPDGTLRDNFNLHHGYGKPKTPETSSTLKSARRSCRMIALIRTASNRTLDARKRDDYK